MTDYQQSIENSFQMLTGQATIETICMALTFQLEDMDEIMMPIFFLEPDAIPEPSQLDSMIDHFEFYVFVDFDGLTQDTPLNKLVDKERKQTFHKLYIPLFF